MSHFYVFRQKTRSGIADGLTKANADSNVRAIVLTGKGKTFPAGADITEFSKGRYTSGMNILNIHYISQ